MKQTNGHPGGLKAGKTLVATELKRVAESQPTAWVGTTPEGDKVHIAYRFGVVSVEVRIRAAGGSARGVWHEVARFRPAEITAEGSAKQSADWKPGGFVRRELAARGASGEARRSIEADMQAAVRRLGGDADLLLNAGRLIIRDSELAAWMHERNSRFAELSRLGIAGGPVPVEVRFLRVKSEDKPAAVAGSAAR